MPAPIDITGQRFGRLLVLSPTKKRQKGTGGVIWKCRCDCGRLTYVPTSTLSTGHTKSCGCLMREISKRHCRELGIKNGGQNRKNITGKRYGRLIALEPTQKQYRRSYFWKCRCDCGKIVEKDGQSLRAGLVKSCGCWNREQIIRQGVKSYKNLTGQKYYKLTVLEKTKERKSGLVVWKCRCDCGKVTYVIGSNLSTGHTKSCGCYRDAAAFARGALMDPMDVPIEITKVMKIRREIKKYIKNAN